MLSRKVVEGQQHIAVLDQFTDGLAVCHAASLDEEIESCFGLDTDFCLPNVVQVTFLCGPKRVEANNRVHPLQSTVLPIGNPRLNGIGDTADKIGGHLRAIDLINVGADIAGRQARRIKANESVIHPTDPGLALQLRNMGQITHTQKTGRTHVQRLRQTVHSPRGHHLGK